jgi:hypothetical protein
MRYGIKSTERNHAKGGNQASRADTKNARPTVSSGGRLKRHPGRAGKREERGGEK